MTTATEISVALPEAAQTFARIEALDWQKIGQNLDEQGNAVLAGVLTPQECKALASLYSNEEGFRSRVVMGRHGFGRGEYKFQLPVTGHHRGDAHKALQQACSVGKQMERVDEDRRALSSKACAIHKTLSRCRSRTSYAFAVAIRAGRLQLSSSGPVWRTCISHSGDIPSLGARQRLYRR